MTDTAATASAPPLDGLKTASSYIAGRLDERIKQRDRLDTRTTLVVATTGGMITVIGVLVALFVKEGVHLSSRLAAMIIVAAILLLLAVLIAQASALLAGNVIKSMHKKDRSIFKQLVNCETDADASAALRLARKANCSWISRLDRACGRQAWGLFAAGLAQLLGVIILGISVVMFLFEAR